MNASAFVFSTGAPVHAALAAKPFLCGHGPVHTGRVPVRSARFIPRFIASLQDSQESEAPIEEQNPSDEPIAQASEPDENVDTAPQPAVEEADAQPVVAEADTPIAQEESPDASAQPVSEESESAEPTATEDAKSAKPERRRRRRTRVRREVTLPLDQLVIGMELEGTVKSVTDYGAFIGGVGTPTDGLLHVSELASGFVENVSDIVTVGQKVKVRVLAVDTDKGNFSLTMKTPEEVEAGRNRTTDAENRRASKEARREEQVRKWSEFSYDPQAFVNAKVTSITDFGGFCQLLTESGQVDDNVPTEGLIHISELSPERVARVDDILKVGQEIKVRVVNTDKKRNRISLSLKSYVEPKAQSEDAADEDLAKSMEAANSNQPVFKTTFELAFERAKQFSKK